MYSFHPNQHKVAYTVVYIQNQKNLLYTVTKKQQLSHILSSLWPQHLIHITGNASDGRAAGEISPPTLTPLALPLLPMLASIAPKQKSSPVALLC